MFKRTSISNTALLLLPVFLGVAMAFALVIKTSTPLEVIGFYSLGMLVVIVLFIYSKYHSIIGGQFFLFGKKSVTKGRFWAYVTAYVVAIFIVLVSLVAIRIFNQ